MVGQQVTMSDINFKMGELSSWINEYFNQATEMKELFDRIGSAGLEALGFSPDDAAVLISAANDLVTAKAAYDQSDFIKRLYGTGIR
jgi:hypothetical protein